ncbi:hypothetical protein [Rathayibacter sp. VKM Ac-2760]|uniref:hypothetical protein n=1 Tax=Rathayibacter sp. VKM Ac-2760 TaxID=2609253 RepID=UPI001317C1F5|nr:hypothetical protein [Rathayibacter sp. VKM Ac-2760]QHC58901.1 hypothetical protein GSU72_10325 [Rathayibacter sp. VKM Ac-2760]
MDESQRRTLLLLAVHALAETGAARAGAFTLLGSGADAEQLRRLDDDCRALADEGLLVRSDRASGSWTVALTPAGRARCAALPGAAQPCPPQTGSP